jgi:mannose-6-phosphate isomerase-like protein (cupin superfamily)
LNPADEAELVCCTDLNAALEALCAEGMRLDVIYPADEPHTALLSGGGRRVRVTTRPEAERPGGKLPALRPEFLLTRSDRSAGEGRAGMLYRDLIPGRLGGRYIASHIRIDGGGPVSDWVHFHRIALQLIIVRAGWVRVVYEDQGEPFVMRAGDLVLQPPEIRHRVLESSPGLEVIEITCPALHETFADHELELPNGTNPDRRFGAQQFLRHVAAETPWTDFHGGEAQETGIKAATGGIAEVRTVRPAGSSPIDFPADSGELAFGFVLDGSAFLDYSEGFAIDAGDAFVVPPGEPWRVANPSSDFRLLHVTTARLG